MTQRAALRRVLHRGSWVGLGGIVVGLWLLEGRVLRLDEQPAAPPVAEVESAHGALPDAPPDARSLPMPSGAPTRIACDEALRVTAFIARELSTPVIPPLSRELAQSWASLFDPHGFWSAAPDSPVGNELHAAAPQMLTSLHEQAPGCAGSRRVAAVWAPWQARLAATFDAAYERASRERHAAREVYELAAQPIFEDDPVQRPGLELAHELGLRLGAFAARFPEEQVLLLQARARYLPQDETALSEIATLAALRAYVPLVDPHGDFAPFDEEWALYAGDDTLDSGSPLWGDVVRTPLGARLVSDPAPPLQLDDLIVSINGLALAGASIDQIEQAARSEPPSGAWRVRVLRQGEPELLSLAVSSDGEAPPSAIEVEHIRYGSERRVLRIAIHDVDDELGEELADVLDREAASASAILLDLRGNGGGSLDAAVKALGSFLPGARLFPLIHRGHVTELLQAPPAARAYTGPLAVLVDGDTASAAEMLAGAVQAYARGVVIGARTFGKGCVQDYFDAVVPSGILRLTTLQFAMPNGKPLQQIGLTPDLPVALAPALERESQITRQPISYSGPDVRDLRVPAGPAWPRASGAPGPCREALVCSILSRLSGVRPGAPTGARAARPRPGTR